MNPAIKRKLLRPFIEIAKATRKLKHELRTPEEIIELRDKIHVELMAAQKRNFTLLVTELTYKEKILNWVLKDGNI